tara:strand:+ start:12020 stop:12343 length:324 start_codon:yes stop_codon:yes gene_type:complete
MIHTHSSEHRVERRAPRQRTLKAGRIAINALTSTFEVLIRDMSQTGARLVMSDVYLLPEYFDLIVLNPNTGRSSRTHCQLVWQKALVVGVKFIRDDLPVKLVPDHIG